jgi:DNA-binding XRE family transcriptional regulator
MRRARQDAELSQNDLAAIVRCSRVSITNIEAGRQRPKMPLALRIADTLNTPVDRLFPSDDGTRPARRVVVPMPEVPTIDPVEFVTRALDNVPEDAAGATADDLNTLGAIGVGVDRHIADVYERTIALGSSVLGGDVPDDEARQELAWLMALRARCEVARDRVGAYLHAWTISRGVDDVWTAAGVAPTTKETIG